MNTKLLYPVHDIIIMHDVVFAIWDTAWKSCQPSMELVFSCTEWFIFRLIGSHLSSSAGAASGEYHAVPPSRPGFSCTNITCQQGFYCKKQDSEAVVCSPDCYTWTQFPLSVNIAIDSAILLAECVGIISGVAIFSVAGLRWRKVYVVCYC